MSRPNALPAGIGEFGLEIDGGTAEDFGVEVDVSGFNLSLMGILPVGERFDLFVKFGMIAWDADGDMISVGMSWKF